MMCEDGSWRLEVERRWYHWDLVVWGQPEVGLGVRAPNMSSYLLTTE